MLSRAADDPPDVYHRHRTDIFATTQVALLLIGLIMSVLVHTYNRYGFKDRARALDETLRIAAPLAYFGYMGSVITYGVTQNTTLLVVLAVFTSLVLVMIIWLNVRRLLRVQMARRIAMIMRIETTQLESTEGEALVRSIFDECIRARASTPPLCPQRAQERARGYSLLTCLCSCCVWPSDDDDRSGSLSATEAATLLCMWKPTLSAAAASNAAREHSGSNRTLGFGQFLELLQEQKTLVLDLVDKPCATTSSNPVASLVKTAYSTATFF